MQEGEKIPVSAFPFFQIDSERKALSFNLQTQSRQTWRSLVSQKYHPRRHQGMDSNRLEANSYHHWHSHSGIVQNISDLAFPRKMVGNPLLHDVEDFRGTQ